jgi:hypothetical protein
MHEAFDFIRQCEKLGVDQAKLKNLGFFGIPGYDRSMCLYEDDPDVQDFIKRLEQESFRIPVFLPRLYRRYYKHRPCNMPFRQLNFDGDSFIGPCCVEGTGKSWGNLLKDSNVWNGTTMIMARQTLTDASIPLPWLCANCEEMIPARKCVGG